MPVVTKSPLAGPPQRHNIAPKRAADQANKLRPKAAAIWQVEAARQDWRPLPASPPAWTVGGTNHKAKKGNSLTAVRAFPDEGVGELPDDC